MHVVAVTLDIHPDHWDAFLAAIQANRTASLRDEPDCHQFDIATNDRHQVYLYELYTDAEGFAAHLRTPHFAEFDGATADMIAAKDIREFTRI